MKHEPSPHAFSIPVRVYYEDTDAGGIVYYANYLKFFERCRTEWMRAIGHDQRVLGELHDIAFVVRSVSVDYLRPARLDDQLTVSVELATLGRAKLSLRQHVRRGDEELVTGLVDIVCVNLSAMKANPIPSFLREQLEKLV